MKTRLHKAECSWPLEYPYRSATKVDAHALTELINIAGEGLPLYIWQGMAKTNESAWNVGRHRAMRDYGGFSYRNSIVRDKPGKVAGCMVGYPLERNTDLVCYQDIPAMFVPLQELEDLASDAWYINVLAVYPDYQGKGFGTYFLTIAEQLAINANKNGLSLIVSDANCSAKRLYERCGFREFSSRPMVKEKWVNPGSNWILMTKKFT